MFNKNIYIYYYIYIYVVICLYKYIREMDYFINVSLVNTIIYFIFLIIEFL